MHYRRRITVRYAETGIEARLKPGGVLNYLQDAATEHCAELGITAMDLLPHNLAWVVYRYHLLIHRYPVWRQALQVCTWRYPANNLYELRRFAIQDADRRTLISAKSAWILIRLDTKKPVRLSPNLPKRVLAEHPAPIADTFAELPEPAAGEEIRSFRVRMHDLDFNRHVNNTVYAVWAMESVPEETAASCLPSEIRIDYRGEAVFGDRITVSTRPLDSEWGSSYLHQVSSSSANGPITRVMTRWEPAERFEPDRSPSHKPGSRARTAQSACR
jgi:medium-chain acyl-[acyl-carrier-protein] hydrolase